MIAEWQADERKKSVAKAAEISNDNDKLTEADKAEFLACLGHPMATVKCSKTADGGEVFERDRKYERGVSEEVANLLG